MISLIVRRVFIMKNRTRLLLPLLFGLTTLSGCDTGVYHTVSIRGNTELVEEMPHLLNKKPQNRFKVGDNVYFKVDIVYDADVLVYFNDDRLSPGGDDYMLYTFVMPDMDSIIDISIRTCPGGGPVCRPDESW